MKYFTAEFDYYATGEGRTVAVRYFTLYPFNDGKVLPQSPEPATLEDAREAAVTHWGYYGRGAQVYEGLVLDLDAAFLVPEWARKFIADINAGGERPGYLDLEFKAHFNFS